jgi:hypothetical protein
MKTGSFFSQPYIALILKVAGIVLIAGTLLDYIFLALPPNFLDSQWLANLINEWVARGTVPLLGLGLLFLGVWFEPDVESSRGLRGLSKIALVLPLGLGLLFLVLAPLYFNSSRLTSAAQTRQINQQADQAERQLNATLERQREQVSSLVSNQEQLAQLQQRLDSINLPKDQQSQLQQAKETLKKVKSDPKALDQEVSKAHTEGLNRIKTQQTTALSQLQSQLRRDRIHTTGSSLLFAVGYLLIAWIGLGGNKPMKAKKQR